MGGIQYGLGRTETELLLEKMNVNVKGKDNRLSKSVVSNSHD